MAGWRTALAITAEDIGASRVRMGDAVGLRDGRVKAGHLFDADGVGHHAEAGE